MKVSGYKIGDVFNRQNEFWVYLHSMESGWVIAFNFAHKTLSSGAPQMKVTIYDDANDLRIIGMPADTIRERASAKDMSMIKNKMTPDRSRKVKTYLITEYLKYMEYMSS